MRPVLEKDGSSERRSDFCYIKAQKNHNSDQVEQFPGHNLKSAAVGASAADDKLARVGRQTKHPHLDRAIQENQTAEAGDSPIVADWQNESNSRQNKKRLTRNRLFEGNYGFLKFMEELFASDATVGFDSSSLQSIALLHHYRLDLSQQYSLFTSAAEYSAGRTVTLLAPPPNDEICSRRALIQGVKHCVGNILTCFPSFVDT